MSESENPTPAYLAARYPDRALRASMAREADEIAVRAAALGNQRGGLDWRTLARSLRDSLRGVTT